MKPLPVDDPKSPRQPPWLFFMLHVNTLNFCAFSMIDASPASAALERPVPSASPVLLAVPSTLDLDGVRGDFVIEYGHDSD